MALKMRTRATCPKFPPDHVPLWCIKGGSAIVQDDHFEQRMQLKCGKWQSWDILELSAKYDLAQYGHVHTLDGDNIPCDWALNNEVVRTPVEQQPRQYAV